MPKFLMKLENGATGQIEFAADHWPHAAAISKAISEGFAVAGLVVSTCVVKLPTPQESWSILEAFDNMRHARMACDNTLTRIESIETMISRETEQ